MTALADKIFENGDPLGLIHDGGARKLVKFVEVWKARQKKSTNDSYFAAVRWHMAGLYDVNLQTGRLATRKKRLNVWRVGPVTLERLRRTAEQHEEEHRVQVRA